MLSRLSFVEACTDPGLTWLFVTMVRDGAKVADALGIYCRDYPDIGIIAEQPAEWMKDKALRVMEDFLTRYPEIDGGNWHR